MERIDWPFVPLTVLPVLNIAEGIIQQYELLQLRQLSFPTGDVV